MGVGENNGKKYCFCIWFYFYCHYVCYKRLRISRGYHRKKITKCL
ncbi:hypothetical protein TAF16_2542 [Anoxybacillus flavithermus]|uniref:Uncharacterized protein n=1 Tax=Anoxybacillus flavithermus TaxID=33934 RepID=A0A178T4J1_9BACL|nr:hypothetical protein TAF16_2542 [Anoxybacillus flavithermus]